MLEVICWIVGVAAALWLIAYLAGKWFFKNLKR